MSAMKQSFQGRKLFFLTTLWGHRNCNESNAPYPLYVGSEDMFHWCVSFSAVQIAQDRVSSVRNCI